MGEQTHELSGGGANTRVRWWGKQTHELGGGGSKHELGGGRSKHTS